MPQEEFAYNESPNRSSGKILFQIVYGIHPRGISELRNLGQDEFQSAGVEGFAIKMKMLRDHIKRQLHDSSQK
jgi:hypothetical protein